MHSHTDLVRWCLSILNTICAVSILYVAHWIDWTLYKDTEDASLRS